VLSIEILCGLVRPFLLGPPGCPYVMARRSLKGADPMMHTGGEGTCQIVPGGPPAQGSEARCSSDAAKLAGVPQHRFIVSRRVA